jgi:hypothetical protein
MNDGTLQKPNLAGPENVPTGVYVKTLPIAVFIIDLKNNDTILMQYQIDFSKADDKQWLGRMSAYAWSKGWSVETMKLSDAEGMENK